MNKLVKILKLMNKLKILKKIWNHNPQKIVVMIDIQLRKNKKRIIQEANKKKKKIILIKGGQIKQNEKIKIN